jgi:hypothetical protein
MRSIGVGDFVADFAGLLYHCGSLAEVPPDVFIARLTTAQENSAIRSPDPARGLPT